jgi:hypothetical protein
MTAKPFARIHRRQRLHIALLLLVAAPLVAIASPNTIATPTNPAPERLPTLGVWTDEKSNPGHPLTMVSAAFPNVPGFVCDSWCYESALEFLGARGLDGGRLELRHRCTDQTNVLFVTTITPEPGAVEFLVHAVTDARTRFLQRA